MILIPAHNLFVLRIKTSTDAKYTKNDSRMATNVNFECRMIPPVLVTSGDNTLVLTIILDSFETGQYIGYNRATTGNMPFYPISNGLGFETIDHRHPIMIGCSSLFRATAATNGVQTGCSLSEIGLCLQP